MVQHEIRDKGMRWLLFTECERREWILGTRAQRSRNLYLVLHCLLVELYYTEGIYYKLSIWMESAGLRNTPLYSSNVGQTP